MNIDISTYRNRIGNFNPVRHSGHKLERKVIRGVYSYKPVKSSTQFNFRKVVIPILLVVFLNIISEPYCQKVVVSSRLKKVRIRTKV